MNKKGFTLVELLAVIVILAVILVIAVPKILDVTNNTRVASIETTTKLIAIDAEKKYMEREILGILDQVNDPITCFDVAKYSASDYNSCNLTFNNGNVTVTIVGNGKFDGYTCIGNKNDVTCSANSEQLATNASCFATEREINTFDINYENCIDYTYGWFSSIEEQNLYCTGEVTNEGSSLEGDIELGYESISDLLESNIIFNITYLNAIAITGYDITCGTDVVIPSNIDNNVVLEIASYSFTDNCTPVESLSYNNKLPMPKQLNYTYDMPKLVPLYRQVHGLGITSVVIPNTVKKIGRAAFLYNNIETIIIPNSVTLIEEEVFHNNPLTSVTINPNPNNITLFCFSFGDDETINNNLINQGFTIEPCQR